MSPAIGDRRDPNRVPVLLAGLVRFQQSQHRVAGDSFSGGAATRRSCATSADFVGGHQSPDLRRPRGTVRSCDRMRGKGIARPEKPREPKQSCRAQTAHAWMWAIATVRQVCWAAESEQAQSRVAWARAVPRDRCDLGHPVVAWPGEAVISSLPAHALLPIVHSSSEIPVALRLRNPLAERRSTARTQGPQSS